MQISGTLMALARAFEPIVFKAIKDSISGIYIIKKRSIKSLNILRLKNKFFEEKVNYNDESLLAFLNSSMNIEFVYLILLGVNQFMDMKVSEH